MIYTFNIYTKDCISKNVSVTQVNIVDVFNYEFPTSSPPCSTPKGMTSCMGRVIWRPSLVRSTTFLTWPSHPFRNSSMCDRPHRCLGRTSSWIRTTSPRLSSVVFPTGRWTSWKFLSSNRYSFVRFQKSSDSCCFSRNSLARFCLTVGSDPVGIVARPSPIRKCAGVSVQNPHLAWWALSWLQLQYWSKCCSAVPLLVLTAPIPFADIS
jgi:hypothetical protein